MGDIRINAAGVICARADGRITVCDESAPCSCPCGTWPPEEWPCGELNEVYAVDNGYTSPYDGAAIVERWELYSDESCSTLTGWYEYRLPDVKALTAHESTACMWVAEGYQWRQSSAPDTWNEQPSNGLTLELYTDTPPCLWQFRVESGSPLNLTRTTGTTPPGTLRADTGCQSSIIATRERRCGAVIVA